MSRRQDRLILTQHTADFFEVVHLGTAFDQAADGLIRGLDGFGNLIDVLRLDDGFKIILKKLCKVI